MLWSQTAYGVGSPQVVWSPLCLFLPQSHPATQKRGTGTPDPFSYLPFVGGVDIEITEDGLQTHFVIKFFIGGAIIYWPAVKEGGKRRGEIMSSNDGLHLRGARSLPSQPTSLLPNHMSAWKCSLEIKRPISFRREIRLMCFLPPKLALFAPSLSQRPTFYPLWSCVEKEAAGACSPPTQLTQWLWMWHWAGHKCSPSNTQYSTVNVTYKGRH